MPGRVATVTVLALAGSVLVGADRAGTVTRPPSKTVWDSVYTTVQAARGETAYVRTCARCHRESLGGADESPALAGSGFLGNWNGLTLAALHDRVRTSMPPDSVGSIPRPTITDVIAYMLRVNGFPAGATELPTDSAVLREIVIQAAR